MFRKFAAVVLCAVTVMMFSSCKNENTLIDIPETTAEDFSADFSEAVTEEIFSVSDNGTQEETTAVAESETVPAETVTAINPSEWSTAEIIDAYKKAASKSHGSVKSEQAITMKHFSINNGQYENVIDFVMPIMSKILANNSSEKDGITGGYQKLSEADVSSAKAYASGSNTVIELVMKNQTDGPYADAMSGSVGHAITAVGDISVVTDQINDLGIAIEISDKDTKINYTDATVKVLIDKDGNIVKGTWKYTVDITLNNYKVGKSTVETTSVVMDNVITVNDGF